MVKKNIKQNKLRKKALQDITKLLKSKTKTVTITYEVFVDHAFLGDMATIIDTGKRRITLEYSVRPRRSDLKGKKWVHA